MINTSNDDLPVGTTTPFAGLHKWLQRGLFICLTALVLEGAFTFPLLAVWYGWPQLTLQEICSEFLKIQFDDDAKECQYPYPLFGPPEGRGQTEARQDKWGVQPKPLYDRVEFREFVRRKEERLATERSAEEAAEAN